MSEGQWLTSVHGIEGWLSRGVGGDLLLEKGHPRAKKLGERARSAQVRTRVVTRSELRRETGNPRARIGAFRPRREQAESDHSVVNSGESGTAPSVTIDVLCREGKRSNNVVLALDQVTDPHNVGAILRSCHWFGVSAVIIPERRSSAINDTVMHVSAGAAAHVSICGVVNLARSLRELASSGYWIYGAETTGEPCDRAAINRPTVVVLGSEGKGLRANVKSACDGFLSIPGVGAVDSLNVSVATGVILYELCARSR